MADANSTPAPAAPAITTEVELRAAIVTGLQAVQTLIAANTSLFLKALPEDLAQLKTTLKVRIKELPIAS